MAIVVYCKAQQPASPGPPRVVVRSPPRVIAVETSRLRSGPQTASGRSQPADDRDGSVSIVPPHSVAKCTMKRYLYDNFVSEKASGTVLQNVL